MHHYLEIAEKDASKNPTPTFLTQKLPLSENFRLSDRKQDEPIFKLKNEISHDFTQSL